MSERDRDLTGYHVLFFNSSGGKDSSAALHMVATMAKEQGVLDRMTVVHANLGRAEWKGVPELVKEQADRYDLPTMYTERLRANGDTEDLLQYAERRGAWPSSQARWCTSDLKRGPCLRVMTMLVMHAREKYRVDQARVLNIFGFRAEESPARAKRPVFGRNKTASNGRRAVYDWLPIHDWAEDEVWNCIHDNDIPYHNAYKLGMPRLSCALCIFAPPPALQIAIKANPELAKEYARVERKIGHKFRKDFSIADLVDETLAGGDIDLTGIDADWNM